MLINGQPLSSFGLEPINADGRIDFTSGDLVITEIPETSGAQLLQTEYDRPRRVSVRVRVRGDDEKGFFDNRDMISDMLGGALEVQFVDIEKLASRVLYCQLEGLRAAGSEDPEFLSKHHEYTMTLVAMDPFYYDAKGLVVGAGDIPIGTGPLRLVTEIGGASTNPLQIALKDFRGNVVQQLKWNATLAAGEWLEIRHNIFSVRKFSAVGTYVDASASIDTTVSNYGFFNVTPDLGSRKLGSWPRIEVVSGAPVSFINKIQRGWN